MHYRDKILLDHGYRSYSAYLKSDMWQGIKDRAGLLRGHQCYCCGQKSQAFHHRYYSEKNLISPDDKEILSSIYPVCNKCHEKIHKSRVNGRFHKMSVSRMKMTQMSRFGPMEKDRKKNNKRRKKKVTIHDQMMADKRFQDEYFARNP